MILFEHKTEDIYLTKCSGFSFVPHIHRHLEILICLDGEIETTCNFQTEALHPGDMMIAFPNNVHSYQKRKESTCLMAIVNPDILTSFTPYFSKRSDSCFFLGGKEKIIHLALDLYEEYLQQEYGEILIGYFYILLGTAFKQFTFTNNPVNADNGTFTKVLLYLSDHFREEITLKEVAKRFGITHFYLSRLFTKQLGCGFVQYIHQLRISYAKRLLKETDRSICDVGFESGFSTLRTFGRVFQKATGMSPSQYRKGNG